MDLAISTNNETIVRAALVLAEGIFESGETLARHPPVNSLRSILYAPLRPPRDVPVDVHIKVFNVLIRLKKYTACFSITLGVCSRR